MALDITTTNFTEVALMANDHRKCPEYWKPAFGFEDRYEVSTHGHVRNRMERTEEEEEEE